MASPTRLSRLARCLASASFLRLIARLMFAALLAAGVGAQAQAQDIDWVVNINDTGSDPTPAGGTISYRLTIGNAGLDNAPATTVTSAFLRARRSPG